MTANNAICMDTFRNLEEVAIQLPRLAALCTHHSDFLKLSTVNRSS